MKRSRIPHPVLPLSEAKSRFIGTCCLLLFLLLLTSPALANTAPVVDVTANQRTDGSGIVDIDYTLSDADGDNCDISVVVSDDGGSNWNITPSALSGDLADVSPGRRQIIWQSKTDLPGEYGTNYRVKVIASGNYTPAGMGFVTIPGGTFQMGDSFDPEGNSDELPVHTVTLSSFLMSKYEITNAQYCDFLNSAYPAEIKVAGGGIVYAASDETNSIPYCDMHSNKVDSQIDFSGGVFTVRSKSGRSMINDPVMKVSWYGANAFCDYYGYRLPTEAEWEYVARGGLPGKRFPWGDTINHDYANYRANGSAYTYDTSPYTSYTYHPIWNDGIYPYTSPVGSVPASINGYGLYDMAGNVWEWCSDWYSSSYYSSSPSTNPTGPATGSSRVIRGGSWGHYARSCRVADRGTYNPRLRGRLNGFRVCLDSN